jgi:hypothetical protein
MLNRMEVIAPPKRAPQYTDASRMIAEVGVRVNVRGRRRATPLVPPSPGRTPIAVPRSRPITAMVRLTGVSATPRPNSRSLKTPASGIGYRS